MPVGTAPALIDCETFEKIQMQLEWSKQDSIRNNKHHQDLGILCGGYAYFGICSKRLNAVYNPPATKGGPEKPGLKTSPVTTIPALACIYWMLPPGNEFSNISVSLNWYGRKLQRFGREIDLLSRQTMFLSQLRISNTKWRTCISWRWRRQTTIL